MNQSSLPTKQNIISAFNHIHNPMSSPEIRKQADRFLIDAQTQSTFIFLMKLLVEIYQDRSYNIQIRLQALLNLSNIIKRNWNNKRLLKTNKQFPQVRKHIQERIIFFLRELTLNGFQIYQQQKILIPSLYEITKFIVKYDYPHTFGEFTQYVINFFQGLQPSQRCIRCMKQIKQIFIQLAQRKGSVSRKNFEESLRIIRNTAGMLGQKIRQQMNKNINTSIIKLSKYLDQIMICIIRISPFQLLDDQESLNISFYLVQKLQFLLSTHSNSNRTNKVTLEKNIKALIYQMGCLQTANPCFFANILSDYIETLFYVISKPEIFVKYAVLKYSLIGMRKVIKQFTYYSQDALFLKSVSSKPKSQNYLQLRKLCHDAYTKFLMPQTIQGMFNFLLTNIMTIKSVQDQGFSINLDQNSSYQKSAEKQLSVHTCGTFLVQILIQRFTDQMVNLIHGLIQTCFNNNWSNIDIPIQYNFLSAISVLPRSFRKNQIQYLSNFPIIQILQYVHSVTALRKKMPQLIVGWLEIFTNQQISSLVGVLLQFIGGQQATQKQLLLYSCYSLNKIINFRGNAVDIGFTLNKTFPLAIHTFSTTDNPDVLWPLINLVSTLITRCQFDTNMIISSLQNNELNSLISSDSFMLIEALADMLKNFLCIIPRNQPAQAVFLITYHFLNHNLKKTQETLHEKLVSLWYYAIRQFSSINHCNDQYLQLFNNHFKRCLYKKSPTLLYVLQQYMLLGLIDNRLENYIQIVLQFYKQANQLESNNELEEGKDLKIAALSFEITLITKYKLAEVNNQQMLWVILEDFCNVQKQQKTIPSKQTSGTLQNSILSIINRYIILNKQFLFNFLGKINLDINIFLEKYFRNMQFLTSRTATKLNTIALISLIPFISHNQNFRNNYLLILFNQIIPQIEEQLKNPELINFPHNNVQNSPIFRFSPRVLSERKQQIRKDTTYINMNLQQLFFKEFGQVQANNGGPIDFSILCNSLGENMAHRLRRICGV